MLRFNLASGGCLAAIAAAAPCVDASAQQQTSPYRPERFDEDWRVIDNDGVFLGD